MIPPHSLGVRKVAGDDNGKVTNIGHGQIAYLIEILAL